MSQSCGRDHPLRCPERLRAMRAGKCWYDYTNHVWWWDWAGYPLPTTTCPGCGGKLPEMWRIIGRVVQGDAPWDGEDGG